MNPITAAIKARKIRKATREYTELAKLNRSAESKAARAEIAARLENYDRF